MRDVVTLLGPTLSRYPYFCLISGRYAEASRRGEYESGGSRTWSQDRARPFFMGALVRSHTRAKTGRAISHKALYRTALAILTKGTARDRPNGNGLIDSQSLLKTQTRTGALGLVEEPDDFAELVVVQFVGRPVLIDQLSNVAVPGSTGGRERRPPLHRLGGARHQKPATDDRGLSIDPRMQRPALGDLLQILQ